MIKNKEKLSPSITYKSGILYIVSTKRNIKCSFVDPLEKKVKTSCSIGIIKIDNKNLITDYERAIEMGAYIAQKIQNLKYIKLSIVIRGLGINRKAVIVGLERFGFVINKFIDLTFLPHNGCRASKVRRKKNRTKVSYKSASITSGF
ncbi:unnamed protein product [Sphacelaria rigidula]